MVLAMAPARILESDWTLKFAKNLVMVLAMAQSDGSEAEILRWPLRWLLRRFSKRIGNRNLRWLL